MKKLTVVVEILHLGIEDVGGLHRLIGFEGTLDDTAGLEIADLDAIEGLALARLNELIFDNGTGIIVDHDFQSALEFVCAISRHIVLVFSN